SGHQSRVRLLPHDVAHGVEAYRPQRGAEPGDAIEEAAVPDDEVGTVGRLGYGCRVLALAADAAQRAGPGDRRPWRVRVVRAGIEARHRHNLVQEGGVELVDEEIEARLGREAGVQYPACADGR